MSEKVFQALIDEVASEPRRAKYAQDVALSIKITDGEYQYGKCRDCSSPSAVFDFSYSVGDTTRTWTLHCASCVLNNILWEICETHGTLSLREKIDLTPLLPERQHRETCVGCGYPIMELGDFVGRSLNYYAQEAVGSDGNTYFVHASCRRECNNENGCGTSYVRETWVHYRDVRNPNNTVNLNVDFKSVFHTEVCSTCFERIEGETQLDYCESCTTWTHRDQFTWSDARDCDVCFRCYNNAYVECNECGREYLEARTHNCYREDDEDENSLYCYSYKPRPTFFGDAPYYMGIELEVECGRGVRNPNISDGVEIVYEHLGRKRVYLKSDGSLTNGFEIVTHPHSLDEYHKLDWSFLNALVEFNFRSWNTDTCGLHVHISRTAFTNKSHMLRFVKFIYDNKKQVQLLSGRSSDWARFNDKGRLVHKLNDDGYFVGDGHYSAVNTENSATLEVRVFRGSLRAERVLSAIEFVHCATEYTRNMKVVPKDRPMAWTRFCSYLVDKTEQYPSLFKIMEETYEKGREIYESEGE